MILFSVLGDYELAAHKNVYKEELGNDESVVFFVDKKRLYR